MREHAAQAAGGATAHAPLRLVERTQRLQRRRFEYGAAHDNLVQNGVRLLARVSPWLHEAAATRV